MTREPQRGRWDLRGHGWYAFCNHHRFAINVAEGVCPNCARVSIRPEPDKALERANARVTNYVLSEYIHMARGARW